MPAPAGGGHHIQRPEPLPRSCRPSAPCGVTGLIAAPRGETSTFFAAGQTPARVPAVEPERGALGARWRPSPPPSPPNPSHRWPGQGRGRARPAADKASRPASGSTCGRPGPISCSVQCSDRWSASSPKATQGSDMRLGHGMRPGCGPTEGPRHCVASTPESIPRIGPARAPAPTPSGRARRRGCIRCLRRSTCPWPRPRPGPGGPPQTSRVGGSPTRDSRPATPGRNQLPATRDPERSWPPGPARTFVKCPARSGHLSGSGLKLFLYCNTSEYIHEFISKYLRI